MDSKLKTGLLKFFDDEAQRASMHVGKCEAAQDESNAQFWRGYQRAFEVARRETVNAQDRLTLLDFMRSYVNGALGRNLWSQEELKKFEHMASHGQYIAGMLARNAVQIT